MMTKAQKYINSKTNSILKHSIHKSNRDVVTTIVYNELSDLLDYLKTSDLNISEYEPIITKQLYNLNHHLYSDVPLKLQQYCRPCSSNCNGCNKC